MEYNNVLHAKKVKIDVLIPSSCVVQFTIHFQAVEIGKVNFPFSFLFTAQYTLRSVAKKEGNADYEVHICKYNMMMYTNI